MQSENISDLLAALLKAQANFSVIEKKRKGYNYRYADLAETLQAIQEPLTANGLSLIHQVEVIEAREVLVTKLMHSSGQWISTRMPLFYKATEKVNPMQAFGSAITYSKRYSIGCLLNLAAEEESDDDGVRSSPSHKSKDYSVTNETPRREIHEVKSGKTLTSAMIETLSPYFSKDHEAVAMIRQKYKCEWTQLPVEKYQTVLDVMKERKSENEVEMYA